MLGAGRISIYNIMSSSEGLGLHFIIDNGLVLLTPYASALHPHNPHGFRGDSNAIVSLEHERSRGFPVESSYLFPKQQYIDKCYFYNSLANGMGLYPIIMMNPSINTAHILRNFSTGGLF